jgi:hypothetical protein
MDKEYIAVQDSSQSFYNFISFMVVLTILLVVAAPDRVARVLNDMSGALAPKEPPKKPEPESKPVEKRVPTMEQSLERLEKMTPGKLNYTHLVGMRRWLHNGRQISTLDAYTLHYDPNSEQDGLRYTLKLVPKTGRILRSAHHQHPSRFLEWHPRVRDIKSNDLLAMIYVRREPKNGEFIPYNHKEPGELVAVVPYSKIYYNRANCIKFSVPLGLQSSKSRLPRFKYNTAANIRFNKFLNVVETYRKLLYFVAVVLVLFTVHVGLIVHAPQQFPFGLFSLFGYKVGGPTPDDVVPAIEKDKVDLLKDKHWFKSVKHLPWDHLDKELPGKEA